MKLLFCLLPLIVFSHFTLLTPVSRQFGSFHSAGKCHADKDRHLPGRNGTCLWFNDQCFIGCDYCTGNETDSDIQIRSGCKEDMGQPIDGILDNYPEMKTYNNWTLPKESFYNPTHGLVDIDAKSGSINNPWFYPGKAPLYSPCGMAGGSNTPKNGFPGNGGYAPDGVTHGFDGRMLPKVADVIWERGSVQEVAVDVIANHGGGDSYRLCKKNGPYELATEECFRAGALKFHGDKSWIQQGEDKSSRVEIPAKRWVVDGIEWSKFPIPACGIVLGGNSRGINMDGTDRLQAGEECKTPQFEPPIPGLFGMGRAQCVFPKIDQSNVGGYFPGDIPCDEETFAKVEKLWNVGVVDLVEIPNDLEPGEYLMSWRHDSEETPQIWANCADIIIV